MTTQEETLMSLKYVEDFLFTLLDPKKTPKVPKKVRLEARYRLKHFPSSFDVYQMLKHKNGEFLEKFEELRREGRL